MKAAFEVWSNGDLMPNGASGADPQWLEPARVKVVVASFMQPTAE